jgi:excinuclease UvrABC nuclease subunit
VTLARQWKDDGARYFGPYRNKSAAQAAVDLINGQLPLRTCPRSFKNARSYGSPCIQLDLGRCLGPCVGRADREQYRALVHDVVAFLDGDSNALRALLWQELEHAAERLDFEKARRLRADLSQIDQIVEAQRRLRTAELEHTLLLVLPSPDAAAREVLLVIQGRLWAQIRTPRSGSPASLAARLAATWSRAKGKGIPAIDQETLDETNILNRWLLRYAGHPAIVPLFSGDPDSSPDWEALAESVLRLSDEDLSTEGFLSADLSPAESEAFPPVIEHVSPAADFETGSAS